MTRRPVILTLLPHYAPAYKAGGPIRTIANMVELLGDEFDFRILTTDRDLREDAALPGIDPNTWTHVGKASVFYADPRGCHPSRMAAAMRAADPDAVYVNTFFTPGFGIMPMILRKAGQTPARARWIFAPRGEFSTGAIALKRAKKRAFIWLSRRTGLHQDVLWHASSQLEAADIRRELGSSCGAIHIASDPPSAIAPLVSHDTSPTNLASGLSVCFLSRISRKKNLHYAIAALLQCRCEVDFHIYGPVEDEAYARMCRGLVPPERSHLRLHWHGPIVQERVAATLAPHDVFFFPTLGENYGHVIPEALGAGVPVLVSDQTPWLDLDAANAGWVRSLGNPQAFVDVLHLLHAMPPPDRTAMRRGAHEYARRATSDPAITTANRELFMRALAVAREASQWAGGDRRSAPRTMNRHE